jgi:hypothetical protein
MVSLTGVTERRVARHGVVVTVARSGRVAMCAVGDAVVSGQAHESPAAALRDGCARHDAEREEKAEDQHYVLHHCTLELVGT